MIGLYHSTDPQNFDKFPENVARETISVAVSNVPFSFCFFNHYFICHHIQKHNQTHGAQAFLLSQSRNSPYFTEPEGSLPHSKKPANCS